MATSLRSRSKPKNKLFCLLPYVVTEIYAYLTVSERILTENFPCKHLDHPEFCAS